MISNLVLLGHLAERQPSHRGDSIRQFRLRLRQRLEGFAQMLDVMLPKLDGFGVLQQVRESKETPVIMLTARERVDDRVRWLRQGVDDYLTKPFSFLEIVERLRALTRRARSQEATVISVCDLQLGLVSRRATRAGTRRVPFLGRDPHLRSKNELDAEEFLKMRELKQRRRGLSTRQHCAL